MDKCIVLTDSDLNGAGQLKSPMNLSLSDFRSSITKMYEADDVVFLTFDNLVHPIKSRTVQYSGPEERKNYEWYRGKNQEPKLIQPHQSKFLGDILRLHRDGVIKLSFSEFHMVVMTLYRDWYNIGNGQQQLNKLRIKYKSYLK